MNNGVNNNVNAPQIMDAPLGNNEIYVDSSVNTNSIVTPKKKKKKGISLNWIFTIYIFFLLIGIVGTYLYMDQKLKTYIYNNTPVTSKDEVELDIQSTLVQSLYSKVRTNINEDISQPKFNDEMKLYLAYRQIPEKDKYESNCNLFSLTSMEPYTCEKSSIFEPHAFKIETLTLALKEMYGENVTIPLKNIQLGGKCIVGYQYIPARGEFVEGYCNQLPNTSFVVNKELVKATSVRNTIIIQERVKYRSKGGREIPDYLKSGLYNYIFRLDTNYNYVLIDKVYEDEYK